MKQNNNISPILSEQSLMIILGGLLVLLITAGICFTIILKQDPKQIRAFRGGRALHYVTILTVVFASILLALEGILSGEAVASILGGIIGYVLGTLKEKTDEKSKDDKTIESNE